jgi:hypothetical protein
MATWQKTNLAAAATINGLVSQVTGTVDLYAAMRVSSWAVVVDINWKSAFNDVRLVNSGNDSVVPANTVDG